MISSRMLTWNVVLGFLTVSALWSACNKEPQPEGRTALEHAYECVGWIIIICLMKTLC